MFEFNRMAITPIVIFNFVLFLFFTLAYLYQFIYILLVFKRGDVKLPPAKKQHSYAFFIAAHNEEEVIGNLVRSIKAQDYPAHLIETFVAADACTDNTAEEARKAGAIVYERNDLARKGKSWVMDYGFNRILNEYGDRFEAFFVFDADNIVSPNYVSIMNQVFDMGYLVATSYRNSKNFDSSWINLRRMLHGLSAKLSSLTMLVCNVEQVALFQVLAGWYPSVLFAVCMDGISIRLQKTFSSLHFVRPTVSELGMLPPSFLMSNPSHLRHLGLSVCVGLRAFIRYSSRMVATFLRAWGAGFSAPMTCL